MSSKIRNVALLLPAFVLATGLAFAQPGVKVSSVNSNGSVTTTTINNNTSGGPAAKAPTAAADGSAKYWDGLGIGGASTNYFSQVPYITAPPNPQIAAGPDDILTIVNRSISRYPNPNAAGNTGTLNPYNYPPTEFVPLDVWMGLTVLGTQAGGGALCPSGTGSNSNCVIDNASIRYDQLQGRFVVLFTVTDLPAHRSNWVLVVSTFSQFQKCPVPAPAGSVCPTSSPLFTPPVIAPIVGGTQTGGQNAANWVLYKIPINLLYNPFQQPNALGLINGNGVTSPTPPFNNPLANSAVGTPNTVSSGGSSATFLTTPFCTNGGPLLPLTYASGTGTNGTGTAGGTGRTCTNYYPTGARMGIDNDNIILTAPVLDQAFALNEGSFPSATGQRQGPYAGTRVTTIAKVVVYNGTNLGLDQPPTCTNATPISCQAINLSDNTATGTLTAINTKIAFGFGTAAVLGVSAAGDLQYNAGGANVPGISPATANFCQSAVPVAVVPTPLVAIPPATNTSSQAVLSCAPIYLNAATTSVVTLPAIFWEPDNLRGRALASFDAQVAPASSGGCTQCGVSGVITPLDYLVGTEITDNFGQGIVRQGVSGITGQPPAVPGTVVAPTAGVATIFYLQPIAFSCPGAALFSGPSGVTFCGSGVPGGQSLIAELPFLGLLRSRVSTLAQVADPAPVGQGFSSTQMTTNPQNIPVSPTTNNRLFVGDSRPTQVMFREGLLYIARSVRLADLQINWLGSSTVIYDVIKTCATAAPSPACGGYSITGGSVTGTNNNQINSALLLETEWFNGQSVPDPGGNLNGFGFYQPMFDVPADVVSAGPVSPINLLPWFDKLFVGMTTGGTNNTAGTFAKNYASLWDFRPGDDAYDTIQPYLDPYTGVVTSSYVCGGDVTVTVLSKSGNTITVADATGLGAGMFQTGQPTIQIVSISGNVVTLTAAFGTVSTTGTTTATFTRTQPLVSVTVNLVTSGSNQITVASTTGLQIGQTITSGAFNSNNTSTAANTPVGNVGTTAYTCISALGVGCSPGAPQSLVSFGIASLTNVGLTEAVSGNNSGNISTNTINLSPIVTVPLSSQVAVGESVNGDNIAGGTSVAAIAVSADGSQLVVTLSANATATGAIGNLRFNSTPCFAAGRVNATTNASAYVVNGTNVPGVTYTGTLNCTSFYADGLTSPQLNGAVVNNGIPVNFASSGLFPAGTTIINIVGNTVTLSNPATTPLTGGAGVIPAGGGAAITTTTNVRMSFFSTSASSAGLCPIIPFSSRGGASTDPNDGSLWLYGQFAKNRLSTIPGPGQWGTSVANYALSFPAVDPYNNDNTYFQDVQPTGSANSAFFTWIQIAKNQGLAVPSATGPCTINNGGTPILQPPAPGTLPQPSPSVLGCPYFGPDTIVTRAEMAYWVVKSIMDETMITNYLCATGGDPSGLSPQCGGGTPSSTFADLGAAGGSILNPFLGANQALGIVGVTNAQLMRYIEVLSRRGITKGCSSTIDPQSKFCPNDPITRAGMAVFLIRAKMGNVFPTSLSGIPLASPYGDNFGTYLPPVPYFSDVTAADPVFGAYYPYIQKMRELRITNGTGGASFSPGNNLTRKEIATFIVRAFFL